MTNSADITDVHKAIETLGSEVEQLKDLFRRRLMDDKSRAAMFESLQDELRMSKDQLSRREFDGLAKEILLVVDRLTTAGGSQYQDLQELALTGADELLEVLWRRGIEQVSADGPLNPRIHEVIATVEVDDPESVGKIHTLNRPGYMAGDRLLRPAQVTVTVANSGSSS